MALTPTELFGPTSGSIKGHLRTAPRDDGVISAKLRPVSGAPVLGWLTPLHFDEVNAGWTVWGSNVAGAATDEVQSYLLGAPTGGTYALTFDGQTTAGIAFNANAATVQAALEALSNIAPGDVVVSGGPSNTTAVVVTFAATYAGQNVPTIVIDPALLTGSTGANPTAATTTTAGSAATQGDSLDGFLWENPSFQSSATLELLVNVLIAGIVHRDDVPLPTGQAQADLDEALRSETRAKGIFVQGITGYH